MKKYLAAILCLTMSLTVIAQNPSLSKAATPQPASNNPNQQQALPKVYDEEADAMRQIDIALRQANATNRKVVCQVGGNWCPWCLKFADFITQDKEIAQMIEENYVYVHINTSKAHPNKDAMARLGNPGRFGYPVLVILGHDGQVMHIQNSSYLEEGKGYNRKKVLEFFQNWTDAAINSLR